MKSRSRIVFGAALALALALPMIGRADDKDEKKAAVKHAVVDFGMPQPQAGGPTTHFLQPVGGDPDGEVTIFKNGTVTFRVNGGGHGVSVYRVSKKTTRDDIIGVSPDGLCPLRSTCTAAFVAAAHTLKDGKGDVVVEIGTNPPFGRVDDAERVLVGTTALIPDGLDANGNQIQVAGIFHQGTSSVPPVRAVGEQIRVKFTKNGKYLVICMNRNHSINDHMFSFVNVVGDDDDDN